VSIARSFILVGLVSLSAIAQQNSTLGTADAPITITRSQAETTAVKQNPRIAAGRLLALAEGQEEVQQRSAELPQIAGNLTAVQAEDGTRIGAGQLNSSRLYTHAGAGGTLSQLVTDFGHTSNLVASARLRAKAEQQNALATEQDVVFATDEAFYKLLTAQSLLDVAKQTVTARRSARDLTKALAASKLKSELDLNTAAANLSQAELLQLDAEIEVQQASAALAALLGESSSIFYKAVEDRGDVPLPPEGSTSIEKEAVMQRPDLRAAQLNTQAEEKFATAQARQNLPTISALAVGGVTPVQEST
jgi:outer membrane protein